MSKSVATRILVCCLALGTLALVSACNAQDDHDGEHATGSDSDSDKDKDKDHHKDGTHEDSGHVGPTGHQYPKFCNDKAIFTEPHPEIIRIGVLSPITGASSSTGSPHEESIKLAHRLHGRGVRVGNSLVEIELVKRDYMTDEDLAVSFARELIDESKVVALLGPGNSGAVARVVEELKGDHVAVLSALATAPSLTNEPGRNFFRVIFDDDTRMKQYATFIKRQDIPGKFAVLFDETSTYGIEICESFKRHFKADQIVYRSWGSLIGSTTKFDDCRRVGDERKSAKRNYTKWIKEFDKVRVRDPRTRVEKPEELKNIAAAILLGSNEGALRLAKRVSRWNPSPQLFFVGSSRKLFGTAPEGSYTIGDPKLDPYRAETQEEGARWTRLLRTYEQQHFQTKDDFIPTAYDAYVAVHEALEIALNRKNGPKRLAIRLRPECLRVGLLNALQNETFNSITSWRKVSFDSRGSLEEDPIAPIYLIRRDAARADIDGSHDWIEVEVDPNQRIFWGPVSVTLTPHGELNGVSSALYLMKEGSDGVEVVVEERQITFAAAPIVEDFYFLLNDRYFVRMSSDYNPANPGFEVKLTGDYLVAFVVALLTGLLVAQQNRLRLRQFTTRVLGGAASSLALVAIAVFMNRWIEIPFLTGSPTLTALIIGLLSGSAGPALVVGILERFASRVTGSSSDGGGTGASATGGTGTSTAGGGG